jgi:hypothetical protein
MKKLIPLLLLMPLIIAGCYPGAPITIGGQTPTINSFNASPASISPGESSNLSWTVSGATTVNIDQGIGNVALTGSRAVAPAATTTYTLTASSATGTTTATTQVIVTGAAPPPVSTGLPVIISFIASPSNIGFGDSTSLSWNVSNATSVSIDNGVGPVGSSGSTIVLPSGTVTYTLTASNSVGSSTANALVIVSGVPPPYPSGGLPSIDYFNASPPIITGGSGSTLLRWGVSNATSVTIDNGIGPVASSGTLLVTLSASVNYTLTATNAYGWRSQTITVLVSGAPPPPTFAVTSVAASVSPPSYTGGCPHLFTFSALITVNGPGTVTYKWERSDGAIAPVQSLTFAAAGSQVVTETWTLGAAGSHWERVRIITPNSAVSNDAVFTLVCL